MMTTIKLSHVEVRDLVIEPDMDYCTLITCTPYGINTYRILVCGYRIANQEIKGNYRVVSDAAIIYPTYVAPFVAIPIILLLIILIIVKK